MCRYVCRVLLKFRDGLQGECVAYRDVIDIVLTLGE